MWRIFVDSVFPKTGTNVRCFLWIKKTDTAKCSDTCTGSLVAHTARIVARTFQRRIERKIEDVLGEDQFGFSRGKGTRDARH
jgi:hypothetical protein